ncbi:MAG: hypothetical protein EZS28_017743 [Streblomastix strix]|uniref:Uncharacterized protein n=1 Tax=Streblomastix strix TaxID=222440 RepID=A0A5J4VVM9_9EUKA|nr:MAG: hypothetical protein EZS28_017743 [Streblomastix strix]
MDVNKGLFEKDALSAMTQMLDTKDYYVKIKVNAIILNIIKAGVFDLKDGQQHPYLQTLTNNGIIAQLFETIDMKDILKQTALYLSYLYKAAPIPIEYRRKIIMKLKSLNNKYYDSLAMLAECPGTDMNKNKVANAVKDKVQKYSDEKYMDQSRYWKDQDNKYKEEIKSKAKQVLAMIMQINNGKNSDQIARENSSSQQQLASSSSLQTYTPISNDPLLTKDQG